MINNKPQRVRLIVTLLLIIAIEGLHAHGAVFAAENFQERLYAFDTLPDDRKALKKEFRRLKRHYRQDLWRVSLELSEEQNNWTQALYLMELSLKVSPTSQRMKMHAERLGNRYVHFLASEERAMNPFDIPGRRQILDEAFHAPYAGDFGHIHQQFQLIHDEETYIEKLLALISAAEDVWDKIFYFSGIFAYRDFLTPVAEMDKALYQHYPKAHKDVETWLSQGASRKAFAYASALDRTWPNNPQVIKVITAAQKNLAEEYEKKANEYFSNSAQDRIATGLHYLLLSHFVNRQYQVDMGQWYRKYNQVIQQYQYPIRLVVNSSDPYANLHEMQEIFQVLARDQHIPVKSPAGFASKNDINVTIHLKKNDLTKTYQDIFQYSQFDDGILRTINPDYQLAESRYHAAQNNLLGALVIGEEDYKARLQEAKDRLDRTPQYIESPQIQSYNYTERVWTFIYELALDYSLTGYDKRVYVSTTPYTIRTNITEREIFNAHPQDLNGVRNEFLDPTFDQQVRRENLHLHVNQIANQLLKIVHDLNLTKAQQFESEDKAELAQEYYIAHHLLQNHTILNANDMNARLTADVGSLQNYFSDLLSQKSTYEFGTMHTLLAQLSQNAIQDYLFTRLEACGDHY